MGILTIRCLVKEKMEPVSICNVLVIAITCWTSFLGFRKPGFESRYIFSPHVILGGQWWRLVTSAFLHANGRHLLFNMVSLYFFGEAIETVFGGFQFLILYLASILGGSLLSLAIHRNHEYRAYGASGGVCGIVFAHIFLFPGGSIYMYFIPIGIPSWIYAIGFLVGSFWAMKERKGNIGHDAHIGGTMAGLLTTSILHPGAIVASPKLFGTVAVIMLAILIYTVKNPLFLPLSNFLPRRKPRVAYPVLRKNSAFKIDDILDKIARGGIQSLTPEEQAFLRESSDKMRRRAQSEKPKSELMF